MARINYTDEQKQEFIELAQEAGIGPAMRELGYPRHHTTATKWLDEYGIKVTVDTLRKRAADLRLFYGIKEKVFVAQGMMERIMEEIEAGSLTADDINKLANAYQRVIQTMNLIEGEATDRREQITKDAQDLEIRRLLNEQMRKNAAIEESVKHS